MANGDVGFAPSEVADRVRGGDGQRDLRRLLADAGDEVRQQIGRDRFRGADGHAPGDLLRCPCRDERHGLSRRRHGPRVFHEIETGVGQDEPLADPFEQCDAKRGLKRHDLTRQGRLGQAKLARRGGERAGLCRDAEGAGLIPIHLVHAYSYIITSSFGNTGIFRMC